MARSGRGLAYVVAENRVTDPELYREYASEVLATVDPFGGKMLVRAGATHTLEGPSPDRLVIIQFDDVEHAMAWWESAEYKAILPLRLRASTGRVYIAEGLPD